MKGFKKITMAVLGVVTLGVTGTAMAVVSIPVGWYAEGNVGASYVNSANYGNGLSNDKRGWGWNINGGYKFAPYFGVEAGYTSYATVKIKSNGTQVAKAKNNYSVDIAAKGIFPISDTGFDVFGKLGISRVSSQVSATNAALAAANGATINTGTNSKTGLYMGLGGEYYFTPNVAANVQWSRAKGNSTTGNLDLYSLGLSYIFA